MTPGLLADDGVRTALRDELLDIEPFADESLQPASYDLRVGRQAFVSGEDAIADVECKGLVVIEAGEFAVIQTRERVRCGPQVAGQIGLTSTYARMGLVLLSGPQIDPGFEGVLVVRVTNLAPKRITLAYEAPFLTAQFFQAGSSRRPAVLGLASGAGRDPAAGSPRDRQRGQPDHGRLGQGTDQRRERRCGSVRRRLRAVPRRGRLVP